MLTRGISGYPSNVAQTLDPERQAQQKQLTTLSLNSQQIIATSSGHHIQLDDPDLVSCAIQEVVQAAKRNRALLNPVHCKVK